MKKIISQTWKFFLDVLFPPQCLNCRLPIADQSKLLCQNCFDEIQLNSSLYCPKCMARLPNRNFLCHDTDYLLAPASRFFPPLPALIHNFKYRGLIKINLMLSGILIAYLKHSGLDISSYSISFIPLHSSKQRERGFNQAETLAKTVSEYFSVPLHPVLKRAVNNKQQAKIKDFQKRAENISGCFQITDAKNVAGKNIVLVDDVSTSGATLAEASRMLKKYGAKRIIALVVAKA